MMQGLKYLKEFKGLIAQNLYNIWAQFFIAALTRKWHFAPYNTYGAKCHLRVNVAIRTGLWRNIRCCKNIYMYISNQQ